MSNNPKGYLANFDVLPDSAFIRESQLVQSRIKFTLVIYEKAHNFDLYKGGSGDFSVSKWDFAHYSQDFDSLEAFAKKVEITQ